ncbi:glutamate 5-kinase [Oceanithermus sp.]
MNGSRILAQSKRIVIKVGSAVISSTDGLDPDRMADLARGLARLGEGRELLLVSSGAIAAAAPRLRQRPQTLAELQAAAALGQPELMRAWQEALSRHGLTAAQVLLTAEDLADRRRYLNARATLERLLDWDVVPVINENDTVMTEEIQFGDNDQLAVRLAGLMGADLVLVLSEAEALFDRDPRTDPEARPVREVERITPEVLAMASDRPGSAGRGGMKSKLLAARMAQEAGIPLWLLPGRRAGVLEAALAGEQLGTFFHAPERGFRGERLWLAQLPRHEGTLVVDAGAARALREQGRSLLAVGIREVKGNWAAGSPVRVEDSNGRLVGIGLVNYAADEVRRLAGHPSSELEAVLGRSGPEEVIHRDHFVLLEEGRRGIVDT